jgi:diguanylate cyclase (GGDEF)-like protein/PAS domain S-box-containing protein
MKTISRPFLKSIDVIASEGQSCTFTHINQFEKKIFELKNEINWLYENASFGCHTLDADGTYLNINSQELKWLGLKREEVVGRKKLCEFLTPNSQATFNLFTHNFIKYGYIEGLELELVGKDGTIRHTSLCSGARKDAEGNVVTMQSALFDITESRQSDMAMKQIKALVNSSNDAIIGKTLAGIITSWNNSAERIFGYSANEIVGLPMQILIPPDRMKEEAEILERIIRGERVESFETVRCHKDGHLINISVTVSPIFDNDNHVIGASKIARDITAQKDAELSLQRSEIRFRNIMEHAPIGIATTAVDGHFLLINQAFCDIVGYSNTELEKLFYQDITHPEDKTLTVADRQMLVDGEIVVYHQEKRYLQKNGRVVWARVTSSYVSEEFAAQPYFISQIEDVTELKQAEIELLNSQSILKKYREQLKAFVQQSPASVAMFDREMNYLFTSNRWLVEHCQSSVEIIGHNYYEIQPDIPAAWKDNHQKGLAGATLKNDEDMWIHADGSEHWTRWALQPWFDKLGNIGGIIIAADDITKQKQNESKLRIAATAFQTQEGMTVTDAEGTILTVNQAFTDITGYSAEDVIGKNPRILSSGLNDAAFYAAMWKCIHDTGKWEGDIWNRRKNKDPYLEHLNISVVKNPDGCVTNYVGTLTDITISSKAAAEIQNLAFYDPLTQLPNRRLLMDRVNQALSSCDRNRQTGALLFIDLDNFKSINDSLGHSMGDRLLKEVAERLKSCVRSGDTVARTGGDEFVVMLEDLSEHTLEAATQAETTGEKILTTLNLTYRIGLRELHNSASIGITLFNANQREFGEIYKQADIAMYQAKKAGRNTLRFFDPKMQEVVNSRTALESELHKAIEYHQFFLYYQIQIGHKQRPTGAEALIRWVHPTRDLVSPTEFIPIAEETGLIIPIGTWVLETACSQIKKWEENELTHDLILSVNVSAKQIHQADFAAQVQAIVHRHGINPNRLKLELTESILLDNMENIISTMNAINSIGVRFSLDDFGTGYSSLQYLKKLPLHQLKIDQSFVRDLAINSNDRAIVHTIIAMAQSLKLDVIAEGVETEEQRQLLEMAGCVHYQGYLFGKPMPIGEFEVLINSGKYPRQL